ncbi:Endoglucanase precursor [compost metagenome]
MIRERDPHRTLIIGGTEWNSIDGLYQLKLPEEDRNIIATFHYYGPILFTHQGAEWMTAEYGTTGLVWPGPPPAPVEPNEAAKQVNWVRSFFEDYNTKPSADNPAGKEALIRDLERAAEWGKMNDRPLFLGEFGVYSTADLASRAAWTETVRSEAERLGMTWAYWEFGAGFGVYDRTNAAWNEELIDALLSSE